uniref:CCHC-type domain-containing protein n=1 Tax=Rhizophora mucronata TaxID=61149 RepID=A0A2P2KQ72_RHIMU
MKIIHRDPMLRAQRVAAIKKAKGTAAARKHTSEALRAFFSDPENRRKRSIAMKGVKFYCKSCGREGHRKHYCPELEDSLIDRRFTCRLCGGKGHNRRTCPKSRTSNHKGRIIGQHHCRICHQSGHNSRTCPGVTGSKISHGDTKMGLVYRCQFCRERGHNRRRCPARNSQPATITIQHEEKGSKHVID